MKKTHKINFGPQHPAAHGVLRLIMELEGEKIINVDTRIGLLHRGTEKLIEHKMYNQSIGYMDRLDYVSMLCNEHAYVLAIEKLLDIEAPIRAKYIRTMFDEITRILNHLLWLGATSLDIGAMSMFLYCFQEREDLLDCYEAATGARMHANYYRPGGVLRDLPNSMPQYENLGKWQSKKFNSARQGSLLDFIDDFTNRFPARVDEYENLLTNNKIWKMRTVGIGIVSPSRAKELGFSGPMLRASGVNWDLRKQEPYSAYSNINFRVPRGTNGDCYDRYLVRIAEMRESNKIIKQCVKWLKENPGIVKIDNPKISPPNSALVKQSMEALIHHFKHFSEGYFIPKSEVYASVEAPKGEFGIFMMSDGANKPYRLKIRAPGFPHLYSLNEMTKGHYLADAVAILSSQDIVLGEIDR
jgi:NADH-quinone oxidoreductase subunit D